jgi:hypothetical protein
MIKFSQIDKRTCSSPKIPWQATKTPGAWGGEGKKYWPDEIPDKNEDFLQTIKGAVHFSTILW